jgi:hypothetical protein
VLLDSGSDVTILHRSTAREIGAKERNKHWVRYNVFGRRMSMKLVGETDIELWPLDHDTAVTDTSHSDNKVKGANARGRRGEKVPVKLRTHVTDEISRDLPHSQLPDMRWCGEQVNITHDWLTEQPVELLIGVDCLSHIVKRIIPGKRCIIWLTKLGDAFCGISPHSDVKGEKSVDSNDNTFLVVKRKRNRRHNSNKGIIRVNKIQNPSALTAGRAAAKNNLSFSPANDDAISISSSITCRSARATDSIQSLGNAKRSPPVRESGRFVTTSNESPVRQKRSVRQWRRRVVQNSARNEEDEPITPFPHFDGQRANAPTSARRHGVNLAPCKNGAAKRTLLKAASDNDWSDKLSKDAVI